MFISFVTMYCRFLLFQCLHQWNNQSVMPQSHSDNFCINYNENRRYYIYYYYWLIITYISFEVIKLTQRVRSSVLGVLYSITQLNS